MGIISPGLEWKLQKIVSDHVAAGTKPGSSEEKLVLLLLSHVSRPLIIA